MVEAQRRFAIDPRRMYAIGHSNGGFFAELVATQLNRASRPSRPLGGARALQHHLELQVSGQRHHLRGAARRSGLVQLQRARPAGPHRRAGASRRATSPTARATRWCRCSTPAPWPSAWRAPGRPPFGRAAQRRRARDARDLRPRRVGLPVPAPPALNRQGMSSTMMRTVGCSGAQSTQKRHPRRGRARSGISAARRSTPTATTAPRATPRSSASARRPPPMTTA
jgi:hypothetical protein